MAQACGRIYGSEFQSEAPAWGEPHTVCRRFPVISPFRRVTKSNESKTTKAGRGELNTCVQKNRDSTVSGLDQIAFCAHAVVRTAGTPTFRTIPIHNPNTTTREYISSLLSAAYIGDRDGRARVGQVRSRRSRPPAGSRMPRWLPAVASGNHFGANITVPVSSLSAVAF